MNKASSPSVARNQEPILEILKLYLNKDDRVLEIGSGTGEHAIHFANGIEGLHWVTSDVKENHPTIKEWLKSAKLKTVHGPELLKVGVDDFPKKPFSHVFTANTLHIMSWKECKTLFKLFGKRLREGSLVFIYGPFNYAGKFTSPSNEQFNQWLKDRDEKSAIRDFEDVQNSMAKAGFKLLIDNEMPANNRLLIFERLPYEKK
jgi:cyclopropane fatty-acyl-phospholipid synthase-like methyltransferase